MTYQKQQEASGEIRITQISEYKLKKMEAKILIKTFKDQQMDQNQKGLTRFNWESNSWPKQHLLSSRLSHTVKETPTTTAIGRTKNSLKFGQWLSSN